MSVHYSTVQYSTVQYSTVQHTTAKYSTAQHSTGQQNTLQYSAVQYSTSHPCNITRESREWCADESVSICTYGLLNHADVILIQVVISKMGGYREMMQKSESEMLSERFEEVHVFLIRRNV